MAQEDPKESRSVRQRGKDVARRVTAPLSSAADAVTGRGVQRELAEYSETVTQVAHGLREDLTALTRRVGALEYTAAQPSSGITGRQSAPTRLYLLAATALAIAVSALAVALWAAP